MTLDNEPDGQLQILLKTGFIYLYVVAIVLMIGKIVICLVGILHRLVFRSVTYPTHCNGFKI